MAALEGRGPLACPVPAVFASPPRESSTARLCNRHGVWAAELSSRSPPTQRVPASNPCSYEYIYMQILKFKCLHLKMNSTPSLAPGELTWASFLGSQSQQVLCLASLCYKHARKCLSPFCSGAHDFLPNARQLPPLQILPLKSVKLLAGGDTPPGSKKFVICFLGSTICVRDFSSLERAVVAAER